MVSLIVGFISIIVCLVAVISALMVLVWRLINRIEALSTRNLMVQADEAKNPALSQKLRGLAAIQNTTQQKIVTPKSLAKKPEEDKPKTGLRINQSL